MTSARVMINLKQGIVKALNLDWKKTMSVVIAIREIPVMRFV
jgi:hypothetical protein